MLLNLLQESPLAFALVAIPLLYSLVLHELAHAWVAERVGDKTARNLGRITLNPLRHLDPIGTVLLLVAGFGWAKPVPIQPRNFLNYRLGLFLVSIAGVVVNFTLALIALFTLGGLGLFMDADGSFHLLTGSSAEALARSDMGGYLLLGLIITARINLILTIFNLLPIPPLDGFKVLQSVMPERVHAALWSLERFGFLIVIALILLFREPIFAFIDGIMSFFMRLVIG